MADPTEKHEGLTVTRYAEVSAHLRHFAREPASAVLPRLGLTKEAWGAADEAWRRAVDDDVEKGDGTLVTAFAAAFAETRRRLEAGEDLSAPETKPAPAAASPTAPATSETPPEEPPEMPPKTLPLAAPKGPPSAGSRWARPPMPSGLQDLQPPLPGGPTPSGLRDPDEDPLNATVSIQPERLGAPVTPFAEAPARAPQIPAPPTLPAIPAFGRGRVSLTGTADFEVGPILERVLPFAKARAAAGAAPPAQPAQPPPTPRPAETTPPRTAAPTPPPRPAEPAPPALPRSALPGLTLEQYASLTAEISLAPERTAEIRARYFIAGDDALRALHAHWQARGAADAALEARIQALIAQYRAWLQHQRRE